MSENKFNLTVIVCVFITFIFLMGFCVLGNYIDKRYQSTTLEQTFNVAYIEHSDGTVDKVKIKFGE